MGKVYLNGKYINQADAKLPITDRGLLFGDSVYEVIPAYAGVPFRAEQHLDRLQRSLDAIRLNNPLSRDDWAAIFQKLCSENPGKDQSIYLQITRGSYETRKHRIPEHIIPNVIVYNSLLKERDPSIAANGIKAITLEDIRWKRCDLKTTNLLANVMEQMEASDRGADDAILMRDGEAKEGTASNLFIIAHGLLITPPDSDQLLSGVTRNLILELALESNIPFAQASISEKDLEEATEIWLTSSTREIAPVVELNGKPVGDGKPGAYWQHMDQLYQAAKQRIRLQAQNEGNS